MTLTDRLAQFFTERPSQWVDGRRLSEIAGAYAWRSRCSDLRLQRGMTIENRVRVVQTAQGKIKVSEYRYVEPKGQGSLFCSGRTGRSNVMTCRL